MQSVINFAKQSCENRDKSHDFAHSERVRDTAKLIAESMNLTEEQIFKVEVVALLHDINDHKYKDNEESLDKFLDENFPNDKELMLATIDRISYSREKKVGTADWDVLKEYLVVRNIVSDADKIDALGAKGLERCTEYTRVFHPNNVEEKVKEHYLEKLSTLEEYVRTPLGKKIAREMTEEMERLIK